MGKHLKAFFFLIASVGKQLVWYNCKHEKVPGQTNRQNTSYKICFRFLSAIQ